ncbi:hypothetical protein [Pontibacter russatus]|uniref:hypothetical protein n=1 Tax=Pontibacter russatus TaxID=2694929 RepID=UPI00137A04C5|nr:hypothetical protein [Pontibacter russatus]
MSFLYDYVSGMEVRRLDAFRAAECLFYLHSLTKDNPGLARQCQPLQEELRELREEKHQPA